MTLADPFGLALFQVAAKLLENHVRRESDSRVHTSIAVGPDDGWSAFRFRRFWLVVQHRQLFLVRIVKLRAVADAEVQREGINERLVLVTDEGDGGGYEMSGGLEHVLVTVTAAAPSSVSSSVSQESLRERIEGTSELG